MKSQFIYHWAGSECNRYERLKTTELACDIRDNERRGRSNLLFIDEGEEPEDVIKVEYFLLTSKSKFNNCFIQNCSKDFAWHACQGKNAS